MRFEFATAGRILAGPGRAADLPAVLAGLGARVLVCTGANPLRHNALIGELGRPPRCLRWPVNPASTWPGPPPTPPGGTAPT